MFYLNKLSSEALFAYLSDASRSGEANLPYEGVGAEDGANGIGILTRHRDDAQEASIESAGLRGKKGGRQSRQWGLVRGFENDGAAGRQGCPRLTGDHREREVPLKKRGSIHTSDQ